MPILRHLWTAVRRTWWQKVLPLDESVGIHKLVGETGVRVVDCPHRGAFDSRGDALLRSVAAEPLAAPHVFFCGPQALADSIGGLGLPFRYERF